MIALCFQLRLLQRAFLQVAFSWSSALLHLTAHRPLLPCPSAIQPQHNTGCAARLVAVTSQGVLSDPAEAYVYRFIIKPFLMKGELQARLLGSWLV
jgi:hypothetical protein